MTDNTERKKFIPSYHDIKYIKLVLKALVPPTVLMVLLLNVSSVLSWVCALAVTVGVVVLATSWFYEVYREVKQSRRNHG